MIIFFGFEIMNVPKLWKPLKKNSVLCFQEICGLSYRKPRKKSLYFGWPSLGGHALTEISMGKSNVSTTLCLLQFYVSIKDSDFCNSMWQFLKLRGAIAALAPLVARPLTLTPIIFKKFINHAKSEEKKLNPGITHLIWDLCNRR